MQETGDDAHPGFALQHGYVLLFYRYFALNPSLSLSEISSLTHKTQSPENISKELANFFTDLCSSLHITGKVRVGQEGFNVTCFVADSETYQLFTRACLSHWSFAKLNLRSADQIDGFLKPSRSDLNAFDSLSVKVTEEITPFKQDVWDFAHLPTQVLTYLSPAEFHRMLLNQDERTLLLDARNIYESRLGHFKSVAADRMLPEIRRFSELPLYLTRRTSRLAQYKTVLSYCTGGIRCDKAGRFLSGLLPSAQVYTLKGGINAYLDWINKEIREGRMESADTLFIGRNQVFDNRDSIGLERQTHPGMPCWSCQEDTFRLGKCQGTGCCLFLLECSTCFQNGGIWCCEMCKAVSKAADARGGRRKGNCQCEIDRAKRVADPDLT